MKKWPILLVILICFSVIYKPIAKNKCGQEILTTSLNSKNLLTYISENKLEEKIKKICSQNMCITVDLSTLESDIKSFIKSNLQIMKSKNEEKALEAELKGFRIEKIILNCS